MMLLKSLLLLLQGRGSNACLEEERVALLQLKASFNCKYSSESYGMNIWRKDVDCCTWDGVSCNATTGRVYQLSLDGSRDGECADNWYFNASMFLPFQELQSLHFRDNFVVCCVKSIEELQKLRNLENLDLSGNDLNNNVLPLLRGLHSLKTLDISSTQLKGSINIKDIKGQSNISVLRLNGGVYSGSSFQVESLKAFSSL
ncbi:hypothetical protein K2173_011425 [Erythroxylum novogranatense]|uniref:Leucine-rich repeat-containing N-terminal plant-type domain-containing protein n=1 Tax=Erythroxylum novogranatense TaxID=1862640 RepID=A0AAV8S6V0_9ROSI|nr:hypothetical protein K2173_011425 [Erythroxylum novogranatense]